MVADLSREPARADRPPRLEAARAMLEQVHGAEQEYRARSPWRMEHEHDMRAARYRVRATVAQGVPPDVLALIGETTRALRAALDEVSTALAGRPVRFPIHESLADFAQRSRKPLAGMLDDARASIEAAQPYHEIGGYRRGALWILRQLDDAPSVSLAAGAVLAGATFGVNTRRKVDLVGDPSVVEGAFDDGTVIAEAVTKIVGPDPKLDMYFTADLVLAFARHGPARGGAVVSSLGLIAECVDSVLASLER